MNLYLESGLAAHRRGRFLTSLLGAEKVDAPPAAGMVLMIGRQFQESDAGDRQKWWEWCSRPGRTLLLLPPFVKGGVTDELDWGVASCKTPLARVEESLAGAVAHEVSQALSGRDGESDFGLDMVWDDGAMNTRIFKRHSCSGIFAATCLPLWSVALLGSGGQVLNWLAELSAGAGAAREEEDFDVRRSAESSTLEPLDFTVLVCLYGFGVENGEELLTRMGADVPVVQLSRKQVATGMARLEQAGCFCSGAVTEAGVAVLRSSPYWAYARQLKEQNT